MRAPLTFLTVVFDFGEKRATRRKTKRMRNERKMRVGESEPGVGIKLMTSGCGTGIGVVTGAENPMIGSETRW